MFNYEQYLNKKYRLARPFLGPNIIEILATYPKYSQDQWHDYHSNPEDGLTHVTSVDPFLVVHHNLNSDTANDIVSDEIRDIANMHVPHMPRNKESMHGTHYINIDWPDVVHEERIRPEIRKQMAHHIEQLLSNNLPLYHTLLFNEQMVHPNAEIYHPFLNDYIKHLNSLPNNQEKPDLLNYLSTYQHVSPRRRLLLRLLAQGFNETYKSPANHVFTDWFKERYGEYAPRPQFKDLVNNYLSSFNPNNYPRNFFEGLQHHIPKDAGEAGFVHSHLFD